MKDYNRAVILGDIYGNLLTKKQYDIFTLYYNDDCSLFEISEKMQISRQAAHDIIKRTMKTLEKYEDALKIYSKLLENRENKAKIEKLIHENKHDEAINLLNKIVEN